MHNKTCSESHLTVQIQSLLNTNQPEQSITYNLLFPSPLGTFNGSFKKFCLFSSIKSVNNWQWKGNPLMQILDAYGNHKACLYTEEMSRGAFKYKQAMLIQLFSEPRCWLLNWSFCQKLLNIPCPETGGKHCPYCKPLAWQLWPWFSNLLFMWVMGTPVSSFTDFSATTCIKTRCRRASPYFALKASAGWLPRLTGSCTSFMLGLHQLWPCAKLGSQPPYFDHFPTATPAVFSPGIPGRTCASQCSLFSAAHRLCCF